MITASGPAFDRPARGPAATAASDDGSDGDGGQVIRLRTKQVHQGFVDHGAPGFSTDDQFVVGNDLYRNGEKVGEDGGTCTVTRIADGGATTLHCLGTNSLPGGQISIQGLAAGRALRARGHRRDGALRQGPRPGVRREHQPDGDEHQDRAALTGSRSGGQLWIRKRIRFARERSPARSTTRTTRT